MTLEELDKRVQSAKNRRGWETLEVVIPNQKPSMGPMGVTKVRGANAGIDWDRGRFIIWPENKMKEIDEKER